MKPQSPIRIRLRQSTLREMLLSVRSLAFAGSRYTCPCCGVHVRTFTHGGGSFRARDRGYCPRCNAKARHRRIWLFLEQHTNLFTEHLSLLHIAPHYSLARRFVTLSNLAYVSADLEPRPCVNVQLDVTAVALPDNTFDAAICVHVLEHVQHDGRAMQELYRVLKPGGWALVSVPIRLDQPTYEDPAITTPEERRAAFGEAGHVRFYGYDLRDRLESCGFRVQLYPAANVDHATRDRYGLLNDENIFLCTKPAVTGA